MEIVNVFDYKGSNILIVGIITLLCFAPCVIIQLIKEYCGFDRKDAIKYKKVDYIIGITLYIISILIIINIIT
jgi:hypothetical protein